MFDEPFNPADVSYTGADAREDAKNKQLRCGTYALIAVATERKTSKNGHKMIGIKYNPLRDRDDVSSKHWLSARHNLVLPLTNNAFPGHVRPKTAGLVYGFLRATMGKEYIPAYPETDGAGWIWQGDRISPDKIEGIKTAVNEAVAARCVELLTSGGSELVGKVVVATLAVNAKDPQYRNLDDFLAIDDPRVAALEFVPADSFVE